MDTENPCSLFQSLKQMQISWSQEANSKSRTGLDLILLSSKFLDIFT